MRSMFAILALLSAAAAPLGAQEAPACSRPRQPLADPLPVSLEVTPEIRAIATKANQIYEHPRMAGPYPRNVVEVAFRRGTTREQIVQALDLVCGEMLGSGTEGKLIRIETDGSGDALWRAIDLLARLPFVERADPDTFVFIPREPIPADAQGTYEIRP